ncbi:hypothetical protein ES703_35574 [subsurface metagenome]
MSNQKKYLSFGAGVNSTALLLLLLDAGEEFEAIFCDLGLELPETYDYLEMIRREIAPVTFIEGRSEPGRTLYEHCVYYRNFPTRRWKWCADRFKIKPINRFYEKPCVSFVGIGSDESHRPTVKIVDPGIEKRFPLIEEGLTREDCKAIIEKHGLPIPNRSGCYICSSQRASQWRELYINHHELYERAKHLEVITNQRLKERGKLPRYFRDKPLPYLVGENQLELEIEDEESLGK